MGPDLGPHGDAASRDQCVAEAINLCGQAPGAQQPRDDGAADFARQVFGERGQVPPCVGLRQRIAEDTSRRVDRVAPYLSRRIEVPQRDLAREVERGVDCGQAQDVRRPAADRRAEGEPGHFRALGFRLERRCRKRDLKAGVVGGRSIGAGRIVASPSIQGALKRRDDWCAAFTWCRASSKELKLLQKARIPHRFAFV